MLCCSRMCDTGAYHFPADNYVDQGSGSTRIPPTHRTRCLYGTRWDVVPHLSRFVTHCLFAGHGRTMSHIYPPCPVWRSVGAGQTRGHTIGMSPQSVTRPETYLSCLPGGGRLTWRTNVPLPLRRSRLACRTNVPLPVREAGLTRPTNVPLPPERHSLARRTSVTLPLRSGARFRLRARHGSRRRSFGYRREPAPGHF